VLHGQISPICCMNGFWKGSLFVQRESRLCLVSPHLCHLVVCARGRCLGVLPSGDASCFIDSAEWCWEFISWLAHCVLSPADTCELTPAYWQIISINESEESALFHSVIYALASSSSELRVNEQPPEWLNHKLLDEERLLCSVVVCIHG